MAVTIVEAACRVGDADDRPPEHLFGIAHRASKGAAEIEREGRVAIIGETAAETAALRLFIRAHALVSSGKFLQGRSMLPGCPPEKQPDNFMLLRRLPLIH